MLKNVTDNVIAVIDTLAFDFLRGPRKITISRIPNNVAGIKAHFINKED